MQNVLFIFKAFAAAGAVTTSHYQPDGRDPKIAARNNVSAGAGTIFETQPQGPS